MFVLLYFPEIRTTVRKMRNFKRIDVPKRINKSLKKMAKINLITLLNENVTKPISKFIKNELIDMHRHKIEAEYHFSSNVKTTTTINVEKLIKEKKKSKPIEFSCTAVSPEKLSLREQIKDFAKRHNPPIEMVNDLLKIMQQNGMNVPKNPNTLYEPLPKFHILNMSFGKYLNFGIEKMISKLFQYPAETENQVFDRELRMDVAMYVLKSKIPRGIKLPQYFLIMGRINCSTYNEPFVIGLYQGTFPTLTIANEILKPFVDEIHHLKSQEIKCGDLHGFKVSLRSIICDPIANSLATCTSLPDSLFGCSKCNQKGQLQFNHGITSFPPTSNLATIRSDDDFKLCLNNSHHIGIPILSELDIGLVSQIFIDYRSIVCEGIMKRLLQLWMTGKLDYRLNKEAIRKISAELLMMASACPMEFRQKPKSLESFETKWDAYDWRQFLLYYGPIILKNYLPHRYYIHFLYMHLAIRLVLSPEHLECSTYVAGQLLNTFVADFSTLYGADLIDYNIHNLLHFENLILNLGPLEDVSGFVFDRHINVITKNIDDDKTEEVSTLEQLGAQILDQTNLLFEDKQNFLSSRPRQVLPYLDNENNIKLKNDLTITSQEPDNHIITKDGVVFIDCICFENDEIILVGRQYLDSLVLYQAPVTNQKLLLVSNLSLQAQTYKLQDILLKAFKVDTSRGICVIPVVNF